MAGPIREQYEKQKAYSSIFQLFGLVERPLDTG